MDTNLHCFTQQNHHSWKSSKTSLNVKRLKEAIPTKPDTQRIPEQYFAKTGELIITNRLQKEKATNIEIEDRTKYSNIGIEGSNPHISFKNNFKYQWLQFSNHKVLVSWID